MESLACRRDIINESLEHSRGVGETERHNEILKTTQRGVEGGLPFIPLTDVDQMVGVAWIHFGEHSDNMSGNGRLFFTVMLFNHQKYMHGRKVCSRKRTLKPQGKTNGQMIPAVRESQMYSLMDSSPGRWKLYRQLVGKGGARKEVYGAFIGAMRRQG